MTIPPTAPGISPVPPIQTSGAATQSNVRYGLIAEPTNLRSVAPHVNGNNKSKSDEAKEALRRRSANYSTRQREWIFGAIISARARLGRPLDDPLNKEIMDEIKSFMMTPEWTKVTGVHKIPSMQTMKCIWKHAMKPEDCLVKKAGRRRLKFGDPLDLEIAENPAAGCKEISNNLKSKYPHLKPLSRSTIGRRKKLRKKLLEEEEAKRKEHDNQVQTDEP